MAYLAHIVQLTNPDELKKALMDLFSEATIRPSDKRSISFVSATLFQKIEAAHTNQVFHVKSKIGQKKRPTKSETVHFTSTEVFTATIHASAMVQKRIVIALDSEKNMAFMRIMDTEISSEALFVFNQSARLWCDIEEHIGTSNRTYAEAGTVITDGEARKGFDHLNTFLADTTVKAKLTNTPHPVPTTFADGSNRTLFFLRHLLPRDRFITITDREKNGNFQAKTTLPHMKALFTDIARVYYTKNCLTAVAATMCRELESNAEGSESSALFNADKLRAIIARRIELDCKQIPLPPTVKNPGIQRLLLEVSALAHLTGWLFDAVVKKHNLPSATVQTALSTMIRHNVSQPAATVLDHVDFGHMLAVALVQTVDIEVKSKYSNPMTTPKKPNVVIPRIVNLSANFYAHPIGYIWENKILYVMRKKNHLYLRDFIDIEQNDLFKKYNIHTEFSNTFAKHANEKPDFKHSISVTCDTMAQIKLTLNSPCTELQGITIDHTENTLP